MARTTDLKLLEKCMEQASSKEIATLARYQEGWHRMWMRVKLLCPECDGRLVYVNKAFDKKWGMCENTCGYRMKAPHYRAFKGAIVKGLTTGEWPDDHWPYEEVEHAPKTAAKRRHAARSGPEA